MTDCVFCTVEPIVCKETEAFLIGSPAPVTKKHYYRFNDTNHIKIEKGNFKSLKTFTPGARLKLKLTEAEEIINHKTIWEMFLKSEKKYGIVFDNLKDAENKELTSVIEKKEVPRDWDLIMISDKQYIFNKRASRILNGSAIQINNNLKNYLQSFSTLKIYNL